MLTTLVKSCPVIPATGSKPSSFVAFRPYLVKKSFSYLNRQYADLEEFVVERDNESGVAYKESSSPNFDRHVRAFVKATQISGYHQILFKLRITLQSASIQREVHCKGYRRPR